MAVDRGTPRHAVNDLTVTTALRGDFAAAHLDGDNAHVLATDTQKNTVFAFARRTGSARSRTSGCGWPGTSPERPVVPGPGWRWRSTPGTGGSTAQHDHAFVRTGRGAHRRGHRRGRPAEQVAGPGCPTWSAEVHRVGVRRLPADRYTTLAETDDRILATAVTARWRHSRTAGRLGAAYADVGPSCWRSSPRCTAWRCSRRCSRWARRCWRPHPELAEIRLSLPNKHHFLQDLTRSGWTTRRCLPRRRPAVRADRGHRPARPNATPAPLAWEGTTAFG